EVVSAIAECSACAAVECSNGCLRKCDPPRRIIKLQPVVCRETRYEQLLATVSGDVRKQLSRTQHRDEVLDRFLVGANCFSELAQRRDSDGALAAEPDRSHRKRAQNTGGTAH